jgi:hypothetical protein
MVQEGSIFGAGSERTKYHLDKSPETKPQTLPSPTRSEMTLRPSQDGFETRYQKNSESIASANGPSRDLVSRSSSESKDDDSNIDLEKQETEKDAKEEKEEEAKDPNLVEWDGPYDPENPQNWKEWRKWVITASMGSMTLCITFASSVFSTATLPTSILFGVSTEVMTLGTSLFVAGFAVGPLVWGPISELYGRKIPLFTGFAIFAIFNIPVAVAQNIETIMLCRFLGGVFGSAPLAVVGGALADFWDPVNRGIAIAVFSGATWQVM